jgi:hypothetical protein
MATSSTSSSTAAAVAPKLLSERLKDGIVALKYDEFAYGQPPGLLDILFESFSLDKHAQLVSTGHKRKRRTQKIVEPSSLDCGRDVHTELEENFKLKRPVRHRYAHWIIELLDSLGWILMAVEVPLIDRVAGIGTRADAVAYNPKDNRVMLIEYKTGYAKHYDSRLYGPSLEMQFGLQITHTPRTRVHLQTAWNWTTFKRNTGIQEVSAVVIRVNDALCKAHLEHIWDWAQVNGEFIVDNVRVFQEKKRVANRAKMAALFPANDTQNVKVNE